MFNASIIYNRNTAQNHFKPRKLCRVSEVRDLGGEATTTTLLGQHNF